MATSNSYYTDADKNKFQKTNLYYDSNSYRMYQDPTIFGFKLLFDFTKSPLLRTDGNVNSALNYLERTGHTQRQALLQQFISHLSLVNQEVPWYFQSIEGLEEAWKRDFYIPEINGEISINCLESIDLKITSLIDLYRKSCFDWQNRREIVPENLRKFKLYIYVVEARRFNSSAHSRRELTDTTQEPTTDLDTRFKKGQENLSFLGYSPDDELDYQQVNRMMFELDFCEIDLESGADAFADINFTDPSTVTQKLKLSYRSLQERNVYRFISESEISDFIMGNLDFAVQDITAQQLQGGDAFSRDTSFGTLNPIKDILRSKSDNLKREAQQKINQLENVYSAENLLQRGANEVNAFLSSRANSLLLGNVYGLSSKSLVEAIAAGNPERTAESGSASLTNDQKSEDLGNTYE